MRTEVIDLFSPHAPSTSARRRALLALPVAALLVAAGCTPNADDQTTAAPTAEQSTVTVTATASPESPTALPAGSTTSQQTDGRFDLVNCNSTRVRQDIIGDVHVRAGQTCVLTDLTVTGEIKVEDGGGLKTRNVHVTEDIDADRYAFVLVIGGAVDGSISLEQGDKAIVKNARIGGSIESEENSGPQVFANNTIGGDLECENNSQNPTGGGNQVNGQREGQCTGL